MIQVLDHLLFHTGPLAPSVLTTLERLEAMSRFKSHAPGLERWIGILLATFFMALVALVIGVGYNMIQQARLAATQEFLENAKRHSLSTQESKLVVAIARCAGLRGRQRNAVFTSQSHFEQGLQRLAKGVLAKSDAEAYDHLLANAAFLREKLGFSIDMARGAMHAMTQGRPTTRDIPIGKILHITRRLASRFDQITAKVVGNDAKQLTVDLERPVRITFGELWRVRYHHGTSVWEFDTSVVSLEGTRLVLKHSAEVRFLNRRRFPRQSAKGVALVAPLPFIQPVQIDLQDDPQYRPVEFARGTLLQVAGPGLQILSPIPAQISERLLVVFEMRRPAQSHLVSDIAIVRRVEADAQGYLLAVELVGHRDTDLEQLLRISRDIAVQPPEEQLATESQQPQQDSVVEQMVTEGTGDA